MPNLRRSKGTHMPQIWPGVWGKLRGACRQNVTSATAVVKLQLAQIFPVFCGNGTLNCFFSTNWELTHALN